MTPAELLALADAATQPKGGWKDAGLVAIREYDKAVLRLSDMALSLARLCAEMGEALDVLRYGYDDHERECASLWEEPSRSMPCDCAVGVIDAALAKLSELEARS